MRPSTLALLAGLAWGCIDDPTPRADPETDADPTADAGAADDAARGTCGAIPTCPDGLVPVDFCVGGDCVEVEACGTTIECGPCGHFPSCPPETQAVDVCPPGLTCERVESSCGLAQQCLASACFCATGEPARVCPPDVSCAPLEGCADAVECPLVACEEVCALPADDCLEGDPFCFFAEVCSPNQACLDPDICGPGGQPYCPADSVYAPDCEADDPRCIEVVACGDTHTCRLPCPVHTVPVDGCLPGDPMCWIVDGQACAPEACRAPSPAELCRGINLLPVDVCRDDQPCALAAFCGASQQCQGDAGPCEDGVVDCGPGRRLEQCQPDGRACQPVYGCGQIGACVECPPDVDCP